MNCNSVREFSSKIAFRTLVVITSVPLVGGRGHAQVAMVTSFIMQIRGRDLFPYWLDYSVGGVANVTLVVAQFVPVSAVIKDLK